MKHYSFGLVIILSLVLVLVACGQSQGNLPLLPAIEPETPVEQPEIKEQPVAPEQTQIETATSELFDWARAEITASNIKTALSQGFSANPIMLDYHFPQDITQIEVTESTKSNGYKNISISYYPTMLFINESHLVKVAGGTFIAACSKLFENPKVQLVSLSTVVDMTDEYGKTKTEPVIQITMMRQTADKVDWKGLAQRLSPDPGNIYRIADDYYIDPNILRRVDLDSFDL